MVKDECAGSFAVRTLETGCHLYDLEIIDLQSFEDIMLESNEFFSEGDLIDKFDAFLRSLTQLK